MMMRFFVLLPLFIFGGIAAIFLSALDEDRDPNAMPSALIGRTVPEFRVARLGGDSRAPVTKADLPTGQPFLINFFASWCIPCIAEHEHLKTLAEADGLPIIGIAWQDEPGSAQAFLDKRGSPYTVVGLDPTNSMGLDFGLSGIPETFVVNAEGRITYHHAGPILGPTLDKHIRPALTAAVEPVEVSP